MSDEPDNDSDEDHPAPRSRKKASQTSRAKKPSAKKPKINGSKPLRPARVTHAAKSLPSRPKKSVRIEDAAVKGTGLYCTQKPPGTKCSFLYTDVTQLIFSARATPANRWLKNG
jgi:cohesin complex subunit SA-1/2